jgi:hypothetical protein
MSVLGRVDVREAAACLPEGSKSEDFEPEEAAA